MRKPIYKSRPVEPNPARYGGERINEFIVMSEAFSNAYLVETPEGNVQLNAGMGLLTAIVIGVALIVDFLLLPPLLMKLEGNKS